MATLTEEEENFLRMFKLINGIASKGVRKIFDQYVPPVTFGTLESYLKAKEIDLRQCKWITRHQISKLFPSSGIVSSSSFDITLMICLIRNFSCFPVQSLIGRFDDLPLSTEQHDWADLARVKYYRNKLAHSEKDTLTKSEFQIMWTDLAEATIRLGGASLKADCDRLMNSNLDNDIIINLRQVVQDMRVEMEQKLTDEMSRIQEIAAKCSCYSKFTFRTWPQTQHLQIIPTTKSMQHEVHHLSQYSIHCSFTTL